MSVQPEQFNDFFRAVYRNDKTGEEFDPFPWQKRLVARVTGQVAPSKRSVWPECLALPTGAGKTACIDIALFALACEADKEPAKRTAPRRIFFVVDRRVIVDEAFQHAESFAMRLHEAEDGILKDVADALRKIAGHQELQKLLPNEELFPLTCHQLRGGMYRDDAWARMPTQPCIIASTVDQIGSRILFRGYGRSFKTWPVHAGLAGNDSLIILDEAHCANPFFQTMQWIGRYRGEKWAKEPLGGPFQFVVMSATPPPGIEDVLRDGDEDRQHPVLGRRIQTEKSASLVVSNGAKGKNALPELTLDLLSRAVELVSEEHLRVAILVNRVHTARLIAALLESIKYENEENSGSQSKHLRQAKKLLQEKCPDGYDFVLLTGRMRPVDRDRLMDHWRPDESDEVGLLNWFGTSRNRPKLERPAFVIATQCIEVGANLDFDAMVSECASLDALRQRFGRLNRTGRDISARAVVVIRADQVSEKNPDPVYAGTLSATWEWLNHHARDNENSDPAVDFGITSMNALWDEVEPDERSKLVLQGANAPVMLPAYVDCWVQTAPEPEASPEVSLFLHGPDEGKPEIQVCWRSDIPARRPTNISSATFAPALIETVALCPPTTLECIPVSVGAFRRWWTDQEDLGAEISDVESAPSAEETKNSSGSVALIWRGPEDSKPVDGYGKNLRPGDTIILPAETKGWEVFGHKPHDYPIDVADHCYLQARRRAVLRLHPDLVHTWPVCPEREHLLEIFEKPIEDFSWPHVRNLLHAIISRDPDSLPMQALAAALDAGIGSHPMIHPFAGFVLRGRPLHYKSHPSLSETFTTEDETSSETAAKTISLADHSQGVCKVAGHFAANCGLTNLLVNSLRQAGKLHDLGKADPRFQAMLHGGNRLRADFFPKLLAKSQGLPVTPKERKQAYRRSGLPITSQKRFPHEFLSLQLVEHCEAYLQNSEWLECWDSVDRDLVLHLVACHHGDCHPFASVLMDDHPDTVDFEKVEGLPLTITADQRAQWTPLHRLDSGVAERFWRLVRRYGWWGLAWLEAMFFLADYRQSESESVIMDGGQEAAILKQEVTA